MVDYAEHQPDPFASAVVSGGYERDRVIAIFISLVNRAVRRRLGRTVGPYDCRILLGDLALEHCKQRCSPPRFTIQQHRAFTTAVTILIGMLEAVARGQEPQPLTTRGMVNDRTRAVLLRWFDRVEKGTV